MSELAELRLLGDLFAERNGKSASFFTASPTDDASVGIDSLVMTSLPDRAVFAQPTPGIWRAALRLIADVVPIDEPSIVVIDDVQRLLGQGNAFEEILQAVGPLPEPQARTVHPHRV